MKQRLFLAIEKKIEKLSTHKISKDRKTILAPLIDFIQSKVSNGEVVSLNFICTHNSRRSHLSQVWAQTMANYFSIKHVFCFSGGTEATALFPLVAETLSKTGFKVESISLPPNPIYSIKDSENANPVIGFSKKFNDQFNPKSGFAAILTCDSANEACPIVEGAAIRIPVVYEDPKAFDGTAQQHEMYMERSMQIATEMYFVFSQVKPS